MDLVKKAAAAITRSDNRVSDPRETNLYMREVDKNGIVLQDTTATEQAKMAAIKALGFVGYLANPDVSRVMTTYLRPLLTVLKDDRSPQLQLEVVRALSGICHRNRVMQDFVMVGHVEHHIDRGLTNTVLVGHSELCSGRSLRTLFW
ncbi:hypothetical protein NP493_35g06010 [Ridgeia piscesae]|uniref:Uncharacterized protein n=1 Tax=Ridgeia piscesae TaxID=27915 RepID=A0AAD9PCS3_RIDPI|nr:hypothetical protein NP493_35g06010 [Ridgeia piscesae]